MRRSFYGHLSVGVLFMAVGAIATADDPKDEAIKKDRKVIEGTWRIVALVVDGNEAKEEDARKLTVVNGADGSWSLNSEGKEIHQGTSSIDPTQKQKTIDFTITEGEEKGTQFFGVYELGENTRKMCFAPPGEARPTELSSTHGSQRVLVTFQREKDDAIKRDRQRIEGTWLVAALEMNGNKAMDDDAKKLKAVIGADGSWNVTVEGNEVNQGTSTIDPLKSPKTIDFTPTVGDDKGKLSLGIYEVSEDTLKFCVAPSGKGRPGEFTSTQSNEQILLTLERVKTK